MPSTPERPAGEAGTGRGPGEHFRTPTGSYRLQLGPGFDFADATDVVPYLRSLGISDLYLSPIFKSRAGSEHGYDVTDPQVVDPARGGEGAFNRLAAAAADAGMGILLDIVPNHMAAAPENPWWRDLLEHGRASRYARFFDIDWEAPGVPESKLLLPVLGEPYSDVLESGDLGLVAEEEGIWLTYRDRRFPVEPGSWGELLGTVDGESDRAADGTSDRAADGGSERAPDPETEELVGELVGIVHALPPHDDGPETADLRRRAAEAAREVLARLVGGRTGRAWVQARLRSFGDVPSGGDVRLDRLLARQPYALAEWRLAAEAANYRRFFDINDMIALRVELPEVFEAVHVLVLRLAEEGKITGLRVDHVDGLWDPLAYLERLQRRLGQAPESGQAPDGSESLYVIVEKILSPREELPPEWPVAGTTGYDFLRVVQGVFLREEGLAGLDDAYRRFTGSQDTFHEVERQKKRQVMRQLFAPEIEALARRLVTLARHDRWARDVPADDLEEAFLEVTACLPVYRTYTRGSPPSARDRRVVARAVREAVSYRSELSEPGVEFVSRLLILRDQTEEMEEEWLAFVMRWQQLTGPITAKGVEDTALYRFNRLLALNEVGSHPDRAPTVEDLHRANLSRRERSPHALNATSTHDTKRSEDVRARLFVLSELAAEWDQGLEDWSRTNRRHRRRVDEREVPDRHEEILIYQTLLGSWPLEEDRPGAEFRDRLRGYLVKALREGKVHTRWRDVDQAYESAVLSFLDGVLDDAEFLERFRPLRDRVRFLGAINSLGQTLLTLLSPGVPDRYQGTELWDFSLVDPDNRRPVDYGRRARLLEDLDRIAARGRLTLADELAESWRDGRVKLWLTAEALRLRRRKPWLVAEGDYLPLRATGSGRANVFAFARRWSDRWAVVAVPRMLTRLPGTVSMAPGRSGEWGDTHLALPRAAPADWFDLYTGRRMETGAHTEPGFAAAALFGHLPFALLLADSEEKEEMNGGEPAP